MSIKVYSMKYMENQAEDLKCEYESTTSKIPNNISLWGPCDGQNMNPTDRFDLDFYDSA